MSGQPALPSVEIDPVAVSIIDDVIARGIASVAPIRLAVATTDAERQVAFRLRFRAIVERGWRPASDFSDGMEHEPIDDEALHIVAWDGEIPAGAVRMIFPRAGRRLPLEDAFSIDVQPPGTHVEVSRVTVAREYSRAGHRNSFALLCGVWLEARRRGYVHFVGDASGSMQRLYRRLGFNVIPLSGPSEYWGEARTFACFDILGSAEALRRIWTPPDQNR